MRDGLLSCALLAGSMLAGVAGAAPLADGAAKFLGNITTDYAVRDDFGTYWNQITAENECKWGSIESKEGVYDFAGCDRAYNWAKKNNAKFKFHTLVWGSQYPSWLANKDVAGTKKAIEAWFDAVAKQYPDLEMIDVVNEAIRVGTNKYHSNYHLTKIIEALGGDNNDDYAFVTKSFQMARERWPKAVLIYNDYNTFQWNVDEGITLVKKIRAAGAPVDAYGQQAHDMMTLDGKGCMNFDSFKSTLKKIHDGVGIPLYITEYDVGTTDDALQKKCYQEQITEFWNAEYVAGVTLWGYIYGKTWIDLKDANGNVIEKGVSGIIKNGTDRPAMTWLKEFMAQNKGLNTTGLLESVPDTVPQAPYNGAIAIPGTLEAENYDVGGQNQSYYDASATNEGRVYREDRVDVVAVTGGYAVGYTQVDEWLEYSVNVAEDGAYDFEATVSSGLDGSSFRLFLDGVAISDTVKIAKGEDWDTYGAVQGSTTDLKAGSHILKIVITGGYGNIDKIVFSQKEEPPTAIAAMGSSLMQNYGRFDVYGITGNHLGTFQANGMADLKTQMTASPLARGSYLVRGPGAGKMMVRLVK